MEIQEVRALMESAPKSNTIKPRLETDKNYRNMLMKAIVFYGHNGCKITEHLNKKGIEVSESTVHRSLRKIFGEYPGKGRPTKKSIRVRFHRISELNVQF